MTPEEEAAELLPCEGGVHMNGVCFECGSSCGCARRPAVSERLANYCEQLRQRDEKIKHLDEVRQANLDMAVKENERIAALEKQLHGYEERIAEQTVVIATLQMGRERIAALAGRDECTCSPGCGCSPNCKCKVHRWGAKG